MLTLRLTRRLADRLRIRLPAGSPPPGNPCADWCGHAFTAARYRYVMLLHPTTFFAVVLHGRGAATADAFIDRVSSGLRDYLGLCGHEFVFGRLIAPELAVVNFAPIGDRRVLGVLNERIFMARVYLEESELSPLAVSDRLNTCPTSPLGFRFPRDVFPPASAPT